MSNKYPTLQVSAFWPFAAPEEAVSSTLNPNARAFTPLNPNAKEFTPQQQTCQRGSPTYPHSLHKESHNSHKESHESHKESQKCSTPDIRLDPPPADESSARTPDNTLGLKPVAERKVRG